MTYNNSDNTRNYMEHDNGKTTKRPNKKSRSPLEMSVLRQHHAGPIATRNLSEL